MDTKPKEVTQAQESYEQLLRVSSPWRKLAENLRWFRAPKRHDSEPIAEFYRNQRAGRKALNFRMRLPRGHVDRIGA